MLTNKPLVPADCDLTDFAFMPLDVRRLLSSETWVLGTSDERAAAMCLWLESWHQVPAGSLPDNDRMLAHLAQCQKWARVREHALRGWVKCSDGRIYHPVVAEKALEAWVEKLLNSMSGATGNAKRWGVKVDIDTPRRQVLAAIEPLRKLAPQSRTLKKKAVAIIVAESPPESPPESQPESPPESPPESQPESQPESPPDSPEDRKGQGQGQGQGFKDQKPLVSSDDETGDSAGGGKPADPPLPEEPEDPVVDEGNRMVERRLRLANPLDESKTPSENAANPFGKHGEPPSENTQECTAKRKPKFDPLGAKPENVSQDAWAGFCEMRARKGKGKELTERACSMIAKKLADRPDADVVVDRSTVNGWSDVYPDDQSTAKGPRSAVLHVPKHRAEDYPDERF